MLIPSYGVVSSLNQIRDLSKWIEDLADTTSLGMSLLSTELATTHLITLQNQAALDHLLVYQGGTCAVIGVECCTYVL